MPRSQFHTRAATSNKNALLNGKPMQSCPPLFILQRSCCRNVHYRHILHESINFRNREQHFLDQSQQLFRYLWQGKPRFTPTTAKKPLFPPHLCFILCLYSQHTLNRLSVTPLT